MKKGKLSADDRARARPAKGEARSGARLLDLWQHDPNFGDPKGCVTTTYTFDAAFFEEQCLHRFIAMESDPDEDARSYLIEREERLSQVFAAVLVDQGHVPLARSLRWHALPVRVPGGILHAKLSLLVWDKHIRVLIGSANMTEPGYRSNFENMAALDFTPGGAIPLALLREALDFLEDVRALSPGRDAELGPQPALSHFLADVRQQVASWDDVAWRRGATSASLIMTGPTSAGPKRPDLFSQLDDLWRSRNFAPPDTAWVMSPFFDDGDRSTETVAALEAILIQRGDRKIHFIVGGREHPSGTIEVDIPECLAKAKHARIKHQIHRLDPKPEDAQRMLHAKSLWLERDQQAVHCIGSSNFTAAGTGWRKSGPLNVEVNLAYVLPDPGNDLARCCALAYPRYVAIDPSADVLYLPPGDRTPEPGAHALLPSGFGAALFVPGSPDAHLDLEIGAPVPPGFVVRSHDGAPLLEETRWRSAGAPAAFTMPWEAPRPPSHLLVTWAGEDGERTAIWTVNVSDSAALPPPEELRQLDLEDLLEMLASARPAHEILGRILARNEARANKRSGPELDPHKKVDTRRFLLQRMRRLSAALEQLRVRITRPVHGIEALTWRIKGPFGPLALADRLLTDEPHAASFFLAEVAETLVSAKHDVLRHFDHDRAAAVFDDAIAYVAAKARALPAPANLAAYVDRTLTELGQ